MVLLHSAQRFQSALLLPPLHAHVQQGQGCFRPASAIRASLHPRADLALGAFVVPFNLESLRSGIHSSFPAPSCRAPPFRTHLTHTTVCCIHAPSPGTRLYIVSRGGLRHEVGPEAPPQPESFLETICLCLFKEAGELRRDV